MDNWTFGRKLGLGFGLAIVALLAIGIVGYRATQQLIANEGLVAHTHQVRRLAAELETDIVSAESGQRGYVLTGKDEFLEPYTTYSARVLAALQQLRELTSDNPEQTRRLDGLKALLDSKLAEMRGVLDLRKTGLEPAIARISEGQGRQTMVDIRKTITEIDTAEAALLAARAREADDSQRFATTAIAWGSAIAIVLVLLTAIGITRSLSRSISAQVRHVQTSSTELQAAANQQASAAKEQATAMAEIATTITELLATSKQISDSASRVSQIAGQTATSARAGDATVVKGSDAIAAVRKQVDLVVQHMLELGKKSQQVGSVLDIVAELAEQTNILAINATIEAAGAGESGRRFGVVADEIRKLADRVGASTKEIRTMIDDVRGAVNTTVMATEAGSKAVDASASEVLEMASAFRHISSMVSTTTDAAREIELSTKQQATAVEQVNVAIGNVTVSTRETEASATQTLQTSQQLTALSGKLMAIVTRGAEARV